MLPALRCVAIPAVVEAASRLPPGRRRGHVAFVGRLAAEALDLETAPADVALAGRRAAVAAWDRVARDAAACRTWEPWEVGYLLSVCRALERSFRRAALRRSAEGDAEGPPPSPRPPRHTWNGRLWSASA